MNTIRCHKVEAIDRPTTGRGWLETGGVGGFKRLSKQSFLSSMFVTNINFVLNLISPPVGPNNFISCTVLVLPLDGDDGSVNCVEKTSVWSLIFLAANNFVINLDLLPYSPWSAKESTNLVRPSILHGGMFNIVKKWDTSPVRHLAIWLEIQRKNRFMDSKFKN